jgi:ABC-type protease/lipase transport system fused ATPase/permease subunit
LLVSAVYMLQVYDCVMSSRRLDMVWPTVATLVAIVIYGVLEQARRLMLGRVSSWLHSELGGPLVRRAMQARIAGWSPSGPNWRPRGHRHRDSSPQASSKRFRLSISPR